VNACCQGCVIVSDAKIGRAGRFLSGGTTTSQLGSEKPEPRTNDHSCWEAVATSLKQHARSMVTTVAVMIFVAAWLRVALWKS